MADFNAAIPGLLAREGGGKFTDDPNDGGGATKFGISQRAYPKLDIRNLTEAQARAIYKTDYWDRIKGDEIVSQPVAESLFDSAVNMGVRTAGRLAQMSLGLATVDGIVGQDTVNAINTLSPETFLANYTLGKVARYCAIVQNDKTQAKYLLGWITRALGGKQ